LDIERIFLISEREKYYYEYFTCYWKFLKKIEDSFLEILKIILKNPSDFEISD